MAIEVRPLRADEYDEAGRVTASAYERFAPGAASPNRDYLRRVSAVAARAEQALMLGAFDGGRVVGTVTLELDGRITGGFARPPLRPDEAHVRMLGVAPEVQRRGIGVALMRECIDRARAEGKRLITLETAEAMTAAQRMYEGMGFRRGPDWVPDGTFRLMTFELPL